MKHKIQLILYCLLGSILCFVGNDVCAQTNQTVTGRVVDQSSSAVEGVTVEIKGTAHRTVTNAEGEYSLTNVAGDATLVFSFVGMQTREVIVGNQTSINIVMEEGAIGIDEVVTVGYGTQKKVNLTGAVSSVNMEEVLGNRPVSSVSAALIGNVPGLVLSGNSGEPGSGYNIKVRGTSSINGGDPLVLVDNVPMDITDINPEDIESVTVLKDASAAAVYGARAAFGVILLTTKKSGKDRPNKFSYSSKISLNRPQELPKRATPLQTLQGVKDAGYVTVWTGQDVATWIDLLTQYEQNPSSFPDGYAMEDGTRYSLRATDMTKDMMERFGSTQIHDFSVAGGSSRSAYRLSLGVLDEDGVIVTDKDRYQRFNVSSFLSSDVSSWLTMQLSLLYSNGKKKEPFSSAFARDVWQQSVYSPSFYPAGGMEYEGEYRPFGTSKNFMETIKPNLRRNNKMNLTGRIILTPFEGLNLTGEYSLNNTYTAYTQYEKPLGNFIDGMTFGPLSPTITESEYRETKGESTYNALNIFATYNKQIDEHVFHVTAGINSERSYYESLWANRLAMINDELPSIGQGTGLITANDDFSEFTLFGTFYRLNYAFQDRYLFEASGRYDGSSKFPENNRFGFFPSFSAGWRISEEGFMASFQPIVSNLKLRASWGSIGNQNIDPYQYTPGMESFLADWIRDGQRPISLRPPGLVRSNFTWEEVRTANGGIEVGLWNNKFNATFDIFTRTTLNMLGPGADYPAVVGASAPLQNAADMQTNGWELQASWRDRVGKVTYGLGFNISDNKSKITKFKNDTKILTAYYEGQTLGEIWGYTFDRFYAPDDFVEGTLRTTAAGELTGGTLKPGIPKVKGNNPNPGDFMFKYPDENGDIWNSANTAEDPGSRRVIGNSSYRHLFGINANVEWNGFSLYVLLQGIGKRNAWLDNPAYIPYSANWHIGLYDYQLDYWTPETPDAMYARIYQGAGYNTATNNQVNTRYLLNAAYLDVKSVVLSYSLPKSLISKINLDNITIFVNGENLWSFNHYPRGTHPDNRVRGAGATYPVMRMFTGGVNITF